MNLFTKFAYWLLLAILIYLVAGIGLVKLDVIFDESFYVDSFFWLIAIDVLIFLLGFFIEAKIK